MAGTDPDVISGNHRLKNDAPIVRSIRLEEPLKVSLFAKANTTQPWFSRRKYGARLTAIINTSTMLMEALAAETSHCLFSFSLMNFVTRAGVGPQ
jgi:hypothetical protein